MVKIKNVDAFVYDNELCYVDMIGREYYVACTTEDYSVPDEYVEYEEIDVEPVVDEYTEDVIRYILKKYPEKLAEIAKEFGINIDLGEVRRKREEKNRRLDEFFA